jgi:hypothetical protein
MIVRIVYLIGKDSEKKATPDNILLSYSPDHLA